MMNLVLVLSALGLGEVPVDLVSRVESGWTSNATESAGGAPDFTLTHSHDLSITGTSGPLSLRGGLALEQQVFQQQSGENDLSLTAGVESVLVLSGEIALRAGYAVTQSWTGEIADLGPLSVAIRSPALEHEFLGEVVVSGPGRKVTFGFDAIARQPGLAEFDTPLLPSLRLDPEVTQVTARVDGEWVITPEMAGLARMHWTLTQVPDIDRLVYGREPANGARFAAGLRLRHGSFSGEAYAGLDLVWPSVAPQLMRQLPYLDASAELAVTEQLSLNARAMAGVEYLRPIDGVASRVIEGELGARLRTNEAVTLTAGVALSREAGLYVDTMESTRHSIHGGVEWAFAQGVALGLSGSHAVLEEPAGPASVTSVGLTLSGKV